MFCHKHRQWPRLPAQVSVPAALSSHSSGKREGGPHMAAAVGQEEMALGERVARVELAVADGVVTSTSTMRDTHRTSVAYRTPRTYLEVLKWMERETSLMDMGDIRDLGAIELLRGMACGFKFYPG